MTYLPGLVVGPQCFVYRCRRGDLSLASLLEGFIHGWRDLRLSLSVESAFWRSAPNYEAVNYVYLTTFVERCESLR